MSKQINRIYTYPIKALRILNISYFIKVYDSVSGKFFFLLLRKDSFMERRIKNKGLYGEWEKESLKIWAHLSKNAENILDVGANTGIYSILSATNNPNSLIYAIEPINVNFNVLNKNIEKNQFKNIKAIQVALTNRDGYAKMFMIRNQLNYMTSIDLNRYENCPWVKHPNIVEVNIPVFSFPSLVKKYKIDFLSLIKIDVEEHEYEVLESMFGYISEHKPNILVEIIGDNRAKKIEALLEPLNYNYVAIHEEKKATVVSHLWDNNHHNFLICDDCALKMLQDNLLVEQCL